MRYPRVNLLLLVLPENGRHVETARTNYGGGTPKFSHLNRKKLHCLPHYATTPTTYDNNLKAEIAGESSYQNFSAMLYQIIIGVVE